MTRATIEGDASTIPIRGDRSLLAAVELFRGSRPTTSTRWSQASDQRSFSRGDVVFLEGREPTELFVVVSGRIAMANRSIDGRESVIALMEAGDLFGDMPLFDGLERSADARVLEPSKVVAIPYAPLRALYETRPELLWNVVRLLALRLRNTDEALADSVFLDVTGRTAKRLLELAGDADEFSLPVTQEELAGMVGASRELVNKAIASFVKLGWIELRTPLPHHQREELTKRAAESANLGTQFVGWDGSGGQERQHATSRRRHRRRGARATGSHEAVVGALVATTSTPAASSAPTSAGGVHGFGADDRHRRTAIRRRQRVQRLAVAFACHCSGTRSS